MSKFFALLLSAVVTTNTIAQNIQSLAIGSPVRMADTKMKSIDGKEFSIKDVTQKNGVLVMFSCNTCPFVKKYQERALNVIKEARDKGVGVIIVNSNEAQRNDEDSYTAMQAYAKAHGYKDVPYVVDANSALANAFGATRTPECFLFNSAGKLVYHGAIDDNPNPSEVKTNYLVMAINQSVSGKDVAVKESRSVGCMIKRM